MLEVSASPATPLANPEGGAAAVSEWLKAEDGEAGDRNSAASRWPKEETMALLKIRSDMDVAFRDTNPKAPLWDQVSKKLAELGYNRSSKKCKEKFENIYKYHRRTKEGRCGKSNGSKTYRFFEQLEALEGHHSLPTPSVSAPETATTTTTTHVPDNNTNVDVILDAVPCSVSAYVGEHSSSTTSCSGKGFRKRKLTQFLDGLMREVIEKQDMLQRKFVEVLEKCEKDRMAREEAWKKEELALIKKERELLAQERSIAAAKDEVVLAFLRKFTQVEGVVQLLEKIQGQNNGHRDMQQSGNINAAANGGGGGDSDVSDMDKRECGNNLSVRNFVHMSSSRWPKDEVEALIRLRTELDVQSHGNNNSSNGVSKGPLWEDISSAMKGLGYERSAKRCKEKWENINKYFKRMKEKNKRKPQDSKTCPYYHHLEVLYSKKPKRADVKDFGKELKPEELLLHIMESQSQEERQAQQQQVQSHSSSEDGEKDDRDQREGDEEDQNGFQNVMLENSPSRAIMS
ncbi:trihelix transcription factor GTL1-like isoform X1 [Vigna umbellata]|uniref:trihelix transcription factor GTL1-like isoform X1 n=1 Tax=Vigna umbellata TaxID=87088 RepID=UPI001F5EFA7D|nr:trihelix transcription factor GTL1-like isoform X1 [Vigna umbellata]